MLRPLQKIFFFPLLLQADKKSTVPLIARPLDLLFAQLNGYSSNYMYRECSVTFLWLLGLDLVVLCEVFINFGLQESYMYMYATKYMYTV